MSTLLKILLGCYSLVVSLSSGDVFEITSNGKYSNVSTPLFTAHKCFNDWIY
jgi:hypothetical protein